jgi:RNA polymerase sigma factor for flagellar operon FliA
VSPPEDVRLRAYKRFKEPGEPTAGPPANVNELIARHAGLVRLWARRYASTNPAVLDWEDLVSVGTMGLVDAWSRWDAASGRPFEVYAEFRVKGAILDELRRVDPFSQLNRRRVRQLTATVERMTHELGREPDAAELAAQLGISEHDVDELRALLRSLHAAPAEEADSQALAREVAISGWSRQELALALGQAIEQLDPRSRTILGLYYSEGLAMREIADILGVTEARVSQLNSAAIARLRTALVSPD